MPYCQDGTRLEKLRDVQALGGERERRRELTSLLLKAFSDVSTVRTSASFREGTCSCTLKAAEKPMSSIRAGADVVPASNMSSVRLSDGSLTYTTLTGTTLHRIRLSWHALLTLKSIWEAGIWATAKWGDAAGVATPLHLRLGESHHNHVYLYMYPCFITEMRVYSPLQLSGCPQESIIPALILGKRMQRVPRAHPGRAGGGPGAAAS